MKGCCTPTRTASEAQAVLDPPPPVARRETVSTNGMRLLSGGAFLMGSESDPPVHEVELAPFYIDTACVTNEKFNEFANATRYRTEAERLGWAFVFVGHLTPAQQAKHVRLRVQGREWWCRIDGANWR